MNRLIVGSVGWNINVFKNNRHCSQSKQEFQKSISEIDKYLYSINIEVDLLLCAGLPIEENNKKEYEIKSTLENLNNIKNIIFERYYSGIQKYVLYRSIINRVTVFPEQLFAYSLHSDNEDAITKEKSNKLANYILNNERYFSINNNHFILVICGENNIIKGNKQNRMIPLILKFCDNQSDIQKLTELFENSVLLNPAHKPYGLYGQKRLAMMKNITKYPAEVKIFNKYCYIKIGRYFHSNNYSLGYKKYEECNEMIESKYPNGSFYFNNGECQRTIYSTWDSSEKCKFILNVWNVNNPEQYNVY